MAKSDEGNAELEALEFRVKAILPEIYQNSYQDVQPVSMGSASLKYTPDGLVAWDEMWGSFCDLAMAGGPPHKGTLLEPASVEEIDAQPERYQEVVDHICRGIAMVTDLYVEPSPVAGWVRVNCLNRGTADWLLRAITMENVSIWGDGLELYLPAGPSYRLEKEIKNVITVMAKTSHYWFGHTSQGQRGEIRNLLTTMEKESPLLQPAPLPNTPESHSKDVRERMSGRIAELTGLRVSSHRYFGWLGIEYPDARSAIWMMRAMIARNILSRREGKVLFIPLDAVRDATGERAVQAVVDLNAFAVIRGML